MAQALGVVDIFVSGKPSEHRLSQKPDQRVSTVLASACVGEHGQTDRTDVGSLPVQRISNGGGLQPRYKGKCSSRSI
jgi:hypothetical protein